MLITSRRHVAARACACDQSVVLRHPHIVGTLELSTSYTWTSAEESLKVCTSKGIYRLSQIELLTFEPKPSSILGIPYEKAYKQMNEVLARVKEAYADKKKTLKGYYPQERWADYGIPDKR